VLGLALEVGAPLERLGVDDHPQAGDRAPEGGDELAMGERADNVAAAKLVVVDAVEDQAAEFFRRWGFVDVPENPRRLFRRISDSRRTLDEQ
jgi:hypothetical protein